jgi:hypothetical protein
MTAPITPTAMPVEIGCLDSPIMVGESLGIVALASTGRRFGRRVEALLLAYYAAAFAWRLWP